VVIWHRFAMGAKLIGYALGGAHAHRSAPSFRRCRFAFFAEGARMWIMCGKGSHPAARLKDITPPIIVEILIALTILI